MAIQFTTLANAVKPIEAQDPQEIAARRMTLQHLGQQIATGAITQQGAALALKQAQQGAADDTAERKLYDAAQTPEELRAGLMKTPHGAAAVLKSDEARAKMRGEAATADKNTAEGKKFQADVAQKQLNELSNQSGALLAMPTPEARAAAWPGARTQLVSKGLATAAELPEQYPGDQWLTQQHQAGIDAAKQVELHIANNKENRDAALFPSQLNKAEGEAQTSMITATQMNEFGMSQADRERIDAHLKEISKNNTAPQLASIAANPNAKPEERQMATDALKILEGHAKAGRAVTNVAAAPALSPEAIQMYAALVRNGGALPTLGRNSGGAIAQISNEAAKGGDVNLAAAKSSYSADKDSEKKLVSNLDAVTAFEKTARANLDTFVGLASKIPDTGVPWLNVPIRKLDEKLVGSANMAAINAARSVANNEIAKVTTSPGLGGVLSDSARHEVEAYNPKDATLAQTLAVAKVLKSDMANRHIFLTDQLKEIRSRIGANGAAAAPASRPPLSSFEGK